MLRLCLVFLLLFTSNLLWFQPNSTASALGNETDHSALLKFKESITNDPFEVLTCWNSSCHFCNWHGVTCSHQQQRVIELNLTGYPLHGFISPHVANLSLLRILNLGNNSFYGSVPQELGHLFRLQILFLFNDMLGGELPISLTNCSELRGLNLQRKFQKMQGINLSGNKLSGEIPTIFGNLSQLFELDLSYNMLIGKIPSTIGNCKHCQRLDLSQNNLSGAIPSQVIGLPSLSILMNLSHNLSSGSLPPEVGMLTFIYRGILSTESYHLLWLH